MASFFPALSVLRTSHENFHLGGTYLYLGFMVTNIRQFGNLIYMCCVFQTNLANFLRY